MTDRYNASHCADMTAAQAIDAADAQRNRERLETRAHSVIGTMLRVAGLAGYEVTGDLELTHRMSGIGTKTVIRRQSGRRGADA